MPFRSGSADHAFSINMLYHVPDPALVFEELHRVLKPGGYFAFEDWFTTDSIDSENLAKLRNNWSSPSGFHNADPFLQN